MGTFFRELVRVTIYKRSQGRITRQVTFAALAVAIALGLLRLSTILQGLDPIITARPAQVVCKANAGRAGAEGAIRVQGADGTATITVHQGEKLEDVVAAIDAQRKTTGVTASMHDDDMVVSSQVVGAAGVLRLDVPAGVFRTEGLDADGAARGQDALNLGLRFLIPLLLLAAGLWTAFRAVNVPGFADFLIAVEAEMNKVSWPTRTELFRSSVVVLIMMFAFGIFLAGCDIFWKLLLSWGLGIL